MRNIVVPSAPVTRTVPRPVTRGVAEGTHAHGDSVADSPLLHEDDPKIDRDPDQWEHPEDWVDIHWKKGSKRDSCQTEDRDGVQVSVTVVEDEKYGAYASKCFDDVFSATKALKDYLRDADKSEKKRWFNMKQALRPLENVWSEISPYQFVQVLEFIGPDAQDYCKCLSFRFKSAWGMPALEKASRLYPGKTVMLQPTTVTLPAYHNPPRQKREMKPEDIPSIADEKKLKCDEAQRNLADEEAWVGSKLYKMSLKERSLIFGECKVQFFLHWTTCRQLLTNDDEIQIHLVKALADTGPKSGVFNSVVGKTILDQAWHKVSFLFKIERFLDVCFLIILFSLQVEQMKKLYPKSSVASWTPAILDRTLSIVFHDKAVFVVLVILIMKNIITPILQLVMACKIYGSSVEKFFSGANVFLFFLEIISGIFIAFIVVDDWKTETDPRKSFSAQHPVWFMLVIFLKWVQFILAMNCSKFFGENVLPAFDAVTRKQSMTYLFYLFLCFFGVFQAYYSLQIPENHAGDKAWDLWVPGLKIFRLLFLGDFDVEELEGEDPPFGDTMLNRTTGVITGGLDDADVDSLRWRLGVAVGFMTVATMITVMMMNVFIGLLSNLYDDAVAQKHQILSHYKSEYCVKLLMLRVLCGCCCCHEEDAPDDDWNHHDGETSPEFPDGKYHMCGFWIASDSNELRDANDVDSLKEDLTDANKNANRTIKVVHRTIDELVRTVDSCLSDSAPSKSHLPIDMTAA